MIGEKWIIKIQTQYSEKSRHFHDISMLDRKMELIGEVVESESLKNALILASIFQYYHYDAKVDRREENCDELKLFADQADIKDVRIRPLILASTHSNLTIKF